MSQCVYCRYLIVGTIVGIIAIDVRELISYLLTVDSPGYYLLSVITFILAG